jgi:hypothetical protein
MQYYSCHACILYSASILAATISDLADDLKKFGTVTVSADSAPVKTAFLWLLTLHFLEKAKSTFYFDCDLQFSSLLAQQKKPIPNNSLLQLCAPDERRIIDNAIAFLSFTGEQEGGLVVLDTLNTLQNLLRGNVSEDPTKANHETATMLTLFQQFAEKGNKLLLVANLTRSRPPSGDGASNWEKEITGGRMSRIKSDVIISVKALEQSSEPSISCDVEYVSERSAVPGFWEGKNYLFDASAFTLR